MNDPYRHSIRRTHVQKSQRGGKGGEHQNSDGDHEHGRGGHGNLLVLFNLPDRNDARVDVNQTAVVSNDLDISKLQAVRGAIMIQIANALYAVPVLTVVPAVFGESWSLAVVETVSVVALIIAFGIAAVACTIRHDV